MIRKENMLHALEEVLVRGVSRKEACERYCVSQSQFSLKFRHLQMVSQNIVRMYPYIALEVQRENI
ncbi:PapB/FocB family fimbrial expression transcriptional regulator [Citrobacter meridianamericanus]